MNLKNYLLSGGTVELEHNYTLVATTGEGCTGFSLFCGGNFVCYKEDFDQLVAQYARLVTRKV